jgi:hypothetical protein
VYARLLSPTNDDRGFRPALGFEIAASDDDPEEVL